MANVLAVGCVDPGFQVIYDRWLRDKFGVGGYYSVRLAGCCYSRLIVVDQITTVQKLAHLDHIVLLPHDDCKMYNFESQRDDIDDVCLRVKMLLSNVTISVFMARLDGTFDTYR